MIIALGETSSGIVMGSIDNSNMMHCSPNNLGYMISFPKWPKPAVDLVLSHLGEQQITEVFWQAMHHVAIVAESITIPELSP